MAPAVLEPEVACCLPVKNSSKGFTSTTIKEIPAVNDAEVLQAPLPNPSLQVTADHRIKTVEAPVLAPKKGEVLLQIKATGVCGSDIHFWKSGRIGTLVVEGDCIIGHEAAGVVIRVGEGITNFVPGDRVAIEPGVPCGDCFLCLEGRYNLCEDVQFAGVYPYHGTLQRYKTHPAKWLYKLPDNISYAQGALLEPLSVVLHGIRTAGLELGTGAVICGAGPIGLIALAAARASGAHPLVITDIEPLRLAFAKELVPGCLTYRVDPSLGAEGNGKAIRALFGTETAGEYVAPRTVLECTGVESSICAAAFAVRRGGTVMVIGVGREVMNNLPFMHISLSEIKLDFINRPSIIPSSEAPASNFNMAHNEHNYNQILSPQEEREAQPSPRPPTLQTISPPRPPPIEILSIKFATSLPPSTSPQLPPPIDIHLAILPHRIPAQSLFHQTPPTQPDLQSYYLNQLAPLCYRDLDLNPSLRALGRQTLDRLTHRILLFCERHLRPVLAALADAGPVILEPIPLVTNDVAREEGLGHSFVPGRGMPRGRVTGALQPVIP
ncbi:hypothetical protein BN1708_009644 [Verticillium longisporum]|uniref:L-arabinitol 4-dehydrogenase n=1 Tax=Verticillium longisporum TaxID=100787 RepID=A0A0G4KJA6_VERLO|nr:hypothetical protein BN1708_009644 [Verticillium longisporum]